LLFRQTRPPQYRLGVWHPVAEAKVEETHEGQPILHLELGLVVGQAVL
jgi:hypothetical protein